MDSWKKESEDTWVARVGKYKLVVWYCEQRNTFFPSVWEEKLSGNLKPLRYHDDGFQEKKAAQYFAISKVKELAFDDYAKIVMQIVSLEQSE